MNTGLTCPQHPTQQFGDANELAAHLNEVHGVPVSPQEILAGQSMSIKPPPTEGPTKGGKTVKQNLDEMSVSAPPRLDPLQIEAQVKASKSQPEISSTSPIEPQAETKPEPIILEYHYLGTCPTCKTPVRTLVVEADTKDKVSVIAFCTNCNKQLETQKEAKI